MNYIGIDPSITSTGMVINGKVFNYSYEKNAYVKSGLSKWFALSEHLVSFKFHTRVKYKTYEEEQIMKIKSYENIVSNIIFDIKKTIIKDELIQVCIEGYSYSSASGKLIDLVTFGTLLRNELLKMGCKIIVISPSTLKLETCKMCYEPIIEEVGVRKKKMVTYHKNNEGTTGGSFKKPEMMRAIIENDDWNDDWKLHLISITKDITGKNVPKPHEDINDAYLLYQYLKSKY